MICHFILFGIVLAITMLPFGLASSFINPQEKALFEGGHFDIKAAIVLIIAIIYGPFAFGLAKKYSLWDKR